MGSMRFITGMALVALGLLGAILIVAVIFAAPHLGPFPWEMLLVFPFLWLVVRGLRGRPIWASWLCAAAGVLIVVALLGRSMLYVYLVTFEGVVAYFRIDGALNQLGYALVMAPWLAWLDRTGGFDWRRSGTTDTPSAQRVDHPTPSP